MHLSQLHHGKETYLRAYSNFIQPVPNIIMWPATSNPKIEPPTVRKMPGRPKKNRRKEEGEIKRAEKLSKRGITITCSICKSIKHNKRKCPSRPEATSATRTAEYNATQQSSTGSTRKRSVVDSQQESTSKEGEARASRRKYKSPRVVGHGVFVSKTGYSCVNQGLQSSRLVTTPTMINSAEVTGDIGYKTSKSLKWKGKPAISQRQLQMKSTMHRVQKKAKAIKIQARSQTGKSPSKEPT
ncbi:PREDICTED: uncharacterized protein LOC109213846 [Nicotiana attenuata]|uniref:uncharacterized protein LOC109213846 n=1 Tax=Nicotiana attenuata TaxID=49451 RepID=UPI00090586AE|nr:PREDICTED: uncharacterized protein LOC109213846 [Nicotiana attenuata]